MTLVFRQYQQADQEAVRKLHTEGLKQFSAVMEDVNLDQDIETIEETYVKKNGNFVVGLLDHQIVCMGAFRYFTNETAEIKRIRVDEKHQSSGLGKRTLTILEELARSQGYSKLILDTSSKQLPAQKLFEQNGYKETHRKQFKELEIIFYQKNLV
ncbi:GNAT family N-acetyltransferase [Paenibacillus lutrae]|uniref:GNAT family N-acetyltransferase n=1 Tax=Paenibacillus lutrae TaxID=2078573 RepID=A0A7X3FLC4_9BACL|nr:GNAT family N-acetyltransferase [Paenibacillus lutrae]MVP01826.1 GNAT family N-acetyltransferase [Paenibacillus lutrae]